MAAKREKKPAAPKKAAPKKAAPKKAAPKKAAPKKTRKKKPQPWGASEYMSSLRQLSGVEEEDVAMMSDPLAALAPVEEWLSTGVLALDRLMGGGWPLTRIVEMAAWESVGKSTLVDQTIGHAQRNGAICALIDSEQARDIEYSRQLGVDPDNLMVLRAETLEQAFGAIDRVLAIQEAHQEQLAKHGVKAPPLLIVLDSLAGTPSEAERKGDAGDTHVAVAARVIKMNFRKITQRIANARACLLFTNQFYQPIGRPGLVTYGGSGVRFFTSVRLWLSRTGPLKIANREVGHVISAKLKKTRVVTPSGPAQLGLLYGAGIHNAYTLFEWGKTKGVGDGHFWIQARGAHQWLMYPDGTSEHFTHQYLGLAEILQAKPELYQQMADQYMTEEA